VGAKVVLIRELTGAPIPFEDLARGPVWEKVGRVTLADTLNNVKTSTQASGAPIRENRPSTIRRKRRKPGRGTARWGVKPLIDTATHIMRAGAWAVTTITNGVAISPKSLDVVRAVQMKGYTGWFGLSKAGRAAVARVFRDVIKALQRRVAGKKKRTVVT